MLELRAIGVRQGLVLIKPRGLSVLQGAGSWWSGSRLATHHLVVEPNYLTLKTE